jgi:hypothetical protein
MRLTVSVLGTLPASSDADAKRWHEEATVTDETTRPVDLDDEVDDVDDAAEPIAPPPAVEPAAGPPTLPPADPPSRGIVGP